MAGDEKKRWILDDIEASLYQHCFRAGRGQRGAVWGETGGTKWEYDSACRSNAYDEETFDDTGIES